jgi:hypothetical protein
VAEEPIVLKVLLQQRHMQGHRAFIREYDAKAAEIDNDLVGKGPSRAQFYRWITGELIGLPYADHCRVLERMFPDWTVQKLFEVHDGGIEFVPEPPRPKVAKGPKRDAGKQADPHSPEKVPSQLGEEFSLAVPRAEFGESKISVFSLPNPEPGRLLDLTWDTFGYGIERLGAQIKNLGSRLDVDICFGVNEAGLVMATFLSSSRFARCPIGYLRCNKVRGGGLELDEASVFPAARDHPVIVLCDFEVKHSDAIGYLAKEVRARYADAELYFAVFGAMTAGDDPRADDFESLAGARNIRAVEFDAIFIAATMTSPGIEPPLELR